jgi:hypothetical protein
MARFSSHFSSRSQLVLAVVAIVSSVLVVALCGTLLVVLSSHARGSAGTTAGGQAQSGQSGQTATAGSTDPTETVAATSTSTPGSSGGGGGGSYRTPTPTPSPGTHAPPSVHQVVNQVTLSGTNSGPVVATCPSGELALSGGWAVVPYNTTGATILRSKRSGTRGWAISVAHALDVTVTSYAECLKDAPGATVAERSATLSVPAGGVAGYKVPCNTGETVVGGGFATQSGVNVLGTTADSVGPPYAWSVGFWNLGTSLASYSVYVECLTYATAHSSANESQLSPIAAGSTGGTTSPACPSGTQVSGGGYAYLSQATGFAYGMSAQRVLGDDGSSYIVWKALLYANGGQSVKLQSLAVCLGFS